jgi:hypothetical protein
MYTPHSHHTLGYFVKNFGTIVGIVLIWRGIWALIDTLSLWIFGDVTNVIVGTICIVVGFLILYLPDHDLKEIEKL